MPPKKSKRSSKPRARKGGYRKRRYAKRMPRVNDVAGVSETIDFYSSLNGAPETNNFVSLNRSSVGNVYTSGDIQLSDFLRASSVAQSYQMYKLKYVEVTFLPDADTFIPGAASGKPYLYYQIDKALSLPITVTNIDLKTSGCKPIALDEKPIHIRWKPAVLLDVMYNSTTNTSSANMIRVSPTLNTSLIPNGSAWAPNDVAHGGIKFFVENNGAPVNYCAKITAHFQFYKPRVQSAPAPPASL